MLFVEFLILTLALMSTILCVSKFVIEIVTVLTGGYNEKVALNEGTIRMVLFLIMSVCWSAYIVFF